MTAPGPVAVYSCVTNGYDRVLPPLDPVPGVDHILFTDRPDVPVRGWQVRPLQMAEDLSPALANRYHKLLPHKVLPDHGASLYLDANIQIKASLAPLLDAVLADPAPFAVYAHPGRTTVAEEVASCLAADRVRDRDAIRAELEAYRAEGFPDAGTLTGNSILIRRHHDPRVIAAMETWWDLVARRSGRDQISLPYLRWKLDLPVQVLRPHFSIESPYFQRYPHWSRGGVRARAYIAVAAQMDRGGLAGQAARAAHALVGRSYGQA